MAMRATGSWAVFQNQDAEPMEVVENEDENDVDYVQDGEELEMERRKRDRIMKYILSLPTPPCSPERQTAAGDWDQTSTTGKDAFERVDTHDITRLGHRAREISHAILPRGLRDSSREILNRPKRPTVRHVPARLPSVQHDLALSKSIRGPQRPGNANQRMSNRDYTISSRSAGTSYCTDILPRAIPKAIPIVPGHLNGLNIMLLSPTSGSVEVERNLNGIADPDEILKEITSDGTQKSYTIRQCSETSSIYADSIHDKEFNGIPPDQSRFKEVWMQAYDIEPASMTPNQSKDSFHYFKRRVSAKSQESAGSGTKSVRIDVQENKSPMIRKKFSFHEAVSAMIIKRKSSRELVKNGEMAPSTSSSSSVKKSRKWANTACTTELPKSRYGTSPMAHREMSTREYSKFESFLRPRLPTPHYHPQPGRESTLSLGIRDIRNLDSAEVATRYKQYLKERQRDRSRHGQKWSYTRDGHGTYSRCREGEEFSWL
ncbi:hypothetical protein POJ06DRAFT_3326 [Lipomyces tetrasporus]|uniref:Uncharacterized protein n=1 Tax=Lipomyces tetrasporus TaxID=54092 RepID=A0AAD7QYJ1_9ASCO|nr:uncharacterized protein POJ06DRAFT_3326 [Lipomyces tetrasporus]KAJ8103548.1 hypothetical protein POJ06DRAFT_3326 [Lipomyces tetrasporus]